MPTEEQVNDVAADLWPDVGASASALGRSKEDVLTEIETVYNEPYLAKFDDVKIRLRHAIGVVYARMLNAETSQAEEFEFLVLDARTPRDVKRKKDGTTTRVAEVSGIIKKIDDKRDWDRSFGKITLWDKHADQALKAALNRGKTFKIWARGGLKEGIYNLTGTDKTHFTDESTSAEGIVVLDFLQRHYRKIAIADAQENISKSLGDMRLVRATVMFARKGESAEGREWGMYRVYDDPKARSKIVGQGNGGFGVMADPTMIRYDQGSVVWFLGNITQTEQYGLGMSAVCAIPEFEVPLVEQAPPKATEATKVSPEQSASKFEGWGQ